MLVRKTKKRLSTVFLLQYIYLAGAQRVKSRQRGEKETTNEYHLLSSNHTVSSFFTREVLTVYRVKSLKIEKNTKRMIE